MRRFDFGDRVRIDIPDSTDLDHERLHGERGTVVSVLKDDADTETGDERDAVLYRVRLSADATVDVRWRDLRPTDE